METVEKMLESVGRFNIFNEIHMENQCTKLEHAPAWKIIENVGT